MEWDPDAEAEEAAAGAAGTAGEEEAAEEAMSPEEAGRLMSLEAAAAWAARPRLLRPTSKASADRSRSPRRQPPPTSPLRIHTPWWVMPAEGSLPPAHPTSSQPKSPKVSKGLTQGDPPIARCALAPN